MSHVNVTQYKQGVNYRTPTDQTVYKANRQMKQHKVTQGGREVRSRRAVTSVRGRKSGSAWTLAIISHRMIP